MWVGLVVLLHPAAILYRTIARSYVLDSFPGLPRLQFLIAFTKTGGGDSLGTKPRTFSARHDRATRYRHNLRKPHPIPLLHARARLSAPKMRRATRA